VILDHFPPKLPGLHSSIYACLFLLDFIEPKEKLKLRAKSIVDEMDLEHLKNFLFLPAIVNQL
ncbi:unnamed protein product, partial [Prunus brigantina]